MSTRWSYDLFIDGKWDNGEAGGRPIEVINPATEEVIGQVPEATPKDAARAIEAARTAFDDGPWPWTKPAERAALRELIVAETGSTGFLTDFVQGAGSVGMFRSNAAQAEHVIEWVEAGAPTGAPSGMAGQAIVREPVGVVSAITPF